MTQGALPKIHTYAQDLEQTRATRGRTTPPAEAVPASVAVANTLPAPRAKKKPVTSHATAPAKPSPKKSPKTTSTPVPAAVLAAPVSSVVAHTPENLPERLPDAGAAPIKITTTATRDSSHPAVVITDKKRARFNLWSALQASFAAWWADQVKAQKARRKPTYSVPAAERRKGVVTQATSNTGRTLTNDQAGLIKRITADRPASPAPIATHETPDQAATSPTWDTAHTVDLSDDALVTASTVVHPVTPAAPTVGYGVGSDLRDEAGESVVSALIADQSRTVSEPTKIVPTIPVFTEPVTPATDERLTTEWEMPTEGEAVMLVEETTVAAPDVVTDQETSAPTQRAIDPVPDTTIAVSAAPEPEPEPVPIPVPTTLAVVPEPEPVLPLVAIPVPQPAPAPLRERIVPTIPTLTTTKKSTVATPVKAPVLPVSAFTALQEPLAPVLPAHLAGAVPSGLDSRRAEYAKQQATRPMDVPSSFPWHLVPYGIIGILIMITLGTIGFVVLQREASDTPVTVTDLPTDVPVDTSLPTYNQIVTAQLDAPNRFALYKALRAVAGNPNEFISITPLAHDSALPLLTRDIFAIINRQLTLDFTANVNSLSLGQYNETPVIIMTVSDAAKAQGYLYQWESTLSQDLSPWFGSAIDSATRFTDTTISNTDVRVLADDTNTARVVYGFISFNTIAITSNETTFQYLKENFQGW